MAAIALNKQTSAHRLILTAVRLFNASEDPLAVHVVGMSALNMLRELVKHGGTSYVHRIFQEAIYLDAIARLEGKPSSLPKNDELDRIVATVADGIRAGEVKQAPDLEINLEKRDEHRLLEYVIGPYNFLKHADRDPLETLDEEDVRPLDAILHAITAYGLLFPGGELPTEVSDFVATHTDEFGMHRRDDRRA